MSLTASSTEDDARNQYLSNSDWYGVLSKARLRKEAIDWYFTHPQAFSAAGRSITMNQQAMGQELTELNAFIASSAQPLITRGVKTARGIW